MSNPFYQQQLPGMLQQLKQNPLQFLLQRRFNVPQNLAQDPDAILNHLLSSGQISQQQVNSAYQMLNNLRPGLK